MICNHSPAIAARLVSWYDTRYAATVIKSFRHKGLEALYVRDSARGIRADHAAKLRRILQALEEATGPHELNHPGYGLHPLKGARKGDWAIKVDGNWRITFRFAGQDVERVDYEDYH